MATRSQNKSQSRALARKTMGLLPQFGHSYVELSRFVIDVAKDRNLTPPVKSDRVDPWSEKRLSHQIRHIVTGGTANSKTIAFWNEIIDTIIEMDGSPRSKPVMPEPAPAPVVVAQTEDERMAFENLALLIGEAADEVGLELGVGNTLKLAYAVAEKMKAAR